MADERLEQALTRVRAWGEAREWAGYDPYDALNSPLSDVLSLRTALGRRFLTQAVKLSPINLRPPLLIRPARNAMAVAAAATGYLRLWTALGDESARAAAEHWLDWLVDNAMRRGDGLAWGYHFDVQTRFFFYPSTSPNTIATSFATQALIDGCLTLGDDRWSEPAGRAAHFLVAEMLVDDPTEPYYRYVPEEHDLIHNANVLACAAVVRAGTLRADEPLLESVARTLRTTLAAQRPDGSWPYAADKGGWVDNYHTGYTLEALAACADAHPEAIEPLERGVEFWDSRLFLADGSPKLLPDQTFPLDGQCYAQAIETWLAVAPWRTDAFAKADRVAGRLIADMLHPDGHIRFQRRRHWTNSTAFVRWTTAPSFSALARLLAASRSTVDPQPTGPTEPLHAHLD